MDDAENLVNSLLGEAIDIPGYGELGMEDEFLRTTSSLQYELTFELGPNGVDYDIDNELNYALVGIPPEIDLNDLDYEYSNLRNIGGGRSKVTITFTGDSAFITDLDKVLSSNAGYGKTWRKVK